MALGPMGIMYYVVPTIQLYVIKYTESDFDSIL